MCIRDRVARDFIQVLNAKDPMTHKSLLEETRAHHSTQDRDAIRLRLTPGATVDAVPGPAERPLELVEAGQGGLVLANTPVVQNTAVIEVNETNLTRFLDRLDRAIKENSEGKFVGSEFEIQAMIDSKMEVMSAFNIVAKMFQGSGTPDTLVDMYKDTFLEYERRKDVLIAAISKLQRLAWNSRGATRDGSRALAAAAVSLPQAQDLEAPSNDDVDHEIKVYLYNLQMLRSIEDQVRTIVYDIDVADMRNEMVSIREDTEHHARQVLVDLAEASKKATKWLKLPGHLSLDSGRKRSLNKLVTEVREQELSLIHI